MKRRLTFLLVSLCLAIVSIQAQKSDIYVVSVGISNYQAISDLTLPEKDAKSIPDANQECHLNNR